MPSEQTNSIKIEERNYSQIEIIEILAKYNEVSQRL